MSNQNMQFQGPGHEQEPYLPQPVNAAPPEQQWQEQPSFRPEEEMDAGGYMGYTGEKIGVGPYPHGRRRRRRGRSWLWIVLVVLLVIILGSGSSSFLARFGVTSTSKVARSFVFGTGVTPNVVITNTIGDISVHTGSVDNVSISATKHSDGFFGNPNDVQVKYVQTADGVTVAVADNSSFFNSESVNFDVTVPQNANLTLKTDTGSIDVNSVDGVLSLKSDTGSITATGDTLTDSSTLQSDTGSVTFNGAIAQGQVSGQQYRFETNTGAVNVTLPKSSQFHVNASTNTGSCDTSFPGVSNQRPDVTGCNINADVGSSPAPTVTLQSDTGSVDLIQGP